MSERARENIVKILLALNSEIFLILFMFLISFGNSVSPINSSNYNITFLLYIIIITSILVSILPPLLPAMHVGGGAFFMDLVRYISFLKFCIKSKTIHIFPVFLSFLTASVFLLSACRCCLRILRLLRFVKAGFKGLRSAHQLAVVLPASSSISLVNCSTGDSIGLVD